MFSTSDFALAIYAVVAVSALVVFLVLSIRIITADSRGKDEVIEGLLDLIEKLEEEGE